MQQNRYMPDSLIVLRTPRLRLSPLSDSDAEDVLRIYADAETWQHLPAGRFTSMDDARRHVAESIRSWREHGLGPWAVRLRQQQAGPDTGGHLIGGGGVRYIEEAGVWNLGYRLDRASWGHGYATELARAAVRRAAQVEPRTPVTARVLAINPASVAVLEKAGLTMVWEGPKPDGAAQGDPSLLSRVYSDRPLGADATRWLIEHS
jgi:RimJ/RimL family protein N-acetyltransferase